MYLQTHSDAAVRTPCPSRRGVVTLMEHPGAGYGRVKPPCEARAASAGPVSPPGQTVATPRRCPCSPGRCTVMRFPGESMGVLRTHGHGRSCRDRGPSAPSGSRFPRDLAGRTHVGVPPAQCGFLAWGVLGVRVPWVRAQHAGGVPSETQSRGGSPRTHSDSRGGSPLPNPGEARTLRGSYAERGAPRRVSRGHLPLIKCPPGGATSGGPGDPKTPARGNALSCPGNALSCLRRRKARVTSGPTDDVCQSPSNFPTSPPPGTRALHPLVGLGGGERRHVFAHRRGRRGRQGVPLGAGQPWAGVVPAVHARAQHQAHQPVDDRTGDHQERQREGTNRSSPGPRAHRGATVPVWVRCALLSDSWASVGTAPRKRTHMPLSVTLIPRVVVRGS